MEITASSVIGKPVYDASAVKVGEVKDLVLNPSTGEAFLVIQSRESEKRVPIAQAVIGEIVLLSEHSSRSCPNCGFGRVPVDANYCPRCGHPLTHPLQVGQG
ncbi:MAG: PRC-barrel domain-containing protein [Thermofilum sp.]